MLSIVRACALIGLDGCIVEVETDFNPRAQIPSFTLVGLPDSAVKESKERVRAAVKNSGLQFVNSGQNYSHSSPPDFESNSAEQEEYVSGLRLMNWAQNSQRNFSPRIRYSSNSAEFQIT